MTAILPPHGAGSIQTGHGQTIFFFSPLDTCDIIVHKISEVRLLSVQFVPYRMTLSPSAWLHAMTIQWVSLSKCQSTMTWQVSRSTWVLQEPQLRETQASGCRLQGWAYCTYFTWLGFSSDWFNMLYLSLEKNSQPMYDSFTYMQKNNEILSFTFILF